LKRDLERQATLLAESLEKSAGPLVANQSGRQLQWLVDRFQDNRRLAGVAVYDAEGKPLAVSAGLASRIGGNPAPIARAKWAEGGSGKFFHAGAEPMHVVELPIRNGSSVIGALAIYNDASFIELREAALWKHALAGMVIQTVL